MNWDFPGAPVVKNPPANVGDVGFVPGLGIKVSRAMGYKSARCNYWARALWGLHITTETQHSKKKKARELSSREKCKWDDISGRRYSQCKGPEAEVSLAHSSPKLLVLGTF